MTGPQEHSRVWTTPSAGPGARTGPVGPARHRGDDAPGAGGPVGGRAGTSWWARSRAEASPPGVPQERNAPPLVDELGSVEEGACVAAFARCPMQQPRGKPPRPGARPPVEPPASISVTRGPTPAPPARCRP